MTEQNIWSELDELQRSFSKHVQYHRVTQTLQKRFDDHINFIVLSFFPDGGTDFLELLPNQAMVVEMDVPTNAKEAVSIVNETTLKQYLLGKSQIQQIRISMALDLLEK